MTARTSLCAWVALSALAALARPACGADAATRPAANGDAPRPIAYYFPNWHRPAAASPPAGATRPAAAADFGEWPTLARAVPRFPGHQQPKRPAWGAQDEADPAVMAQKVAAAADHGIAAFVFCWYYHAEGPYLSRALDDGYLRAADRARVPFALMWANHDVGSRKGAVDRPTFDRMADLLVDRYFRDPAYWRVNGRCYFSLYEPDTFVAGLGGPAAARAAIDDLRSKARRAGCGELHVNLIDWQPSQQPDPYRRARELGADSLTSYVWVHTVPLRGFPADDYARVRAAYFANWDRRWAGAATPHFPNVTMGWDPTPRLRPDQRHTGRQYPDTPVLTGNTVDAFRAALTSARDRAATLPPGERFVALYAWNEWTEGGYLEPDATTGTAYLDAVRDVFGG